MRAGLIVGGVIVGIIGLFFTATLIGAIIGIPLMIVGAAMFFVGLFTSGRRDQIIVNQQVGYPTIQQVQVRCLNCGTLNSDQSSFCSKCGKPLKT